MRKIVIFVGIICLLGSCANNNAANEAAQQHTIDSLKEEAVKKQIIDSLNQVNAMQQKQVVATESERPHHRHYYSGSNGSSSEGVAATENTNDRQRKGWSAKAKGAVIGAGVGGITGALVDKNKGQGALIGGAVGAASGLGVGAIIDKKDKRK